MRDFKVLLLSATILAGAASTAQAADIYGGSLKDPVIDEPIVYTPPIGWGGLYFGGHLGAAFNEDESYFEGNGEDDDIIDFGNDDTTWLAGLHVGYNWHRPSGWLFGVEGDVSFADDVDYLASIRARLGYAFGETLFYATGGAAFLGFENEIDFLDDDDSAGGWVAGLGIERKLRQNVSIGLEGLYYDFDTDEGFEPVDGGVFYQDDKDFWVVRARLSYHLGGDVYETPLK
jgi:outer membrane immunogenic protein